MGAQGQSGDSVVWFRSGNPVAVHFESWREYEDIRGPGDFFDVVTRRDREAGFSPTEAIPWPTFVLGSGCLTPLTGARLDDDTLLGLIRSALDGLPSAQRVDGDAELVDDFLRSLVDMKLEQGSTPTEWLLDRSKSAASTFPWAIAIQVCLLAAVATRAYTEFLNATVSVLGRAEREEIVYDTDERPELARLFGVYVRPMDELSSRLQRGPGFGKAWASFTTLLEAMGGRVDGRRFLRRQHVELLAAFAWHFLTDGTEIYPGWSDILLFHAFDLDSDEFRKWPVPQRPRKRAAALEADSWMYQRLRKVTERSLAVPEPFYGTVADVVCQQASVLETLYPAKDGPLPTGVPRATVFVTSFDVELEMALLDRAERFAIVMPVVGTHSGAKRTLDASVHWIYRVVDVPAGADKAALLTELLQGTDWQEMPKDDTVPRAIDRLPIAVHLAGAPLLALPESLPGVSHVSHALLLDETIAIMQFGAEVRGAGSDRLSSRLLLSPKQTQNKIEPAPRYWTFVGTPHADPAVRLRLLANGWNKLVDTEEAGRKKDDGEDPRQAGVVVNRWAAVGDSEAFRWQGFDVVAGETEEMIDELVRFTRRVAEERLARIPEAAGV